MPVWLGALLGVPALLLSAKAHGRQVRLEREAAGYHSVEFGGGRDRSRGEDASQRVRNDPDFVEKLWRRDRIRFWSFVPAAALALGGATWLARADVGATLLAALLWAPIAGFFFAGLWAYASRRGEGGAWWWASATLTTAASIIAANA